jgi:hypothetical protein
MLCVGCEGCEGEVDDNASGWKGVNCGCVVLDAAPDAVVEGVSTELERGGGGAPTKAERKVYRGS